MSIHYAGAGDIVAAFERDIRTGARSHGSRLPTVRALARDTGLAPGTVAAAYRVLRERGFVATDGRRGTVVRTRAPLGLHAVGPDPLPEGVRDLAVGGPDLTLLPPLPVPARRHVQYGAPAVDPRLAALAAERLAADGIPSDQLTVTGGALDGIDRLLATSLAPGDRVAVEDPGWGNLFDLMASRGIVPEPVPVDEDGPLPDGLARAISGGARAAVLTIAAQNPTGAAVSRERSEQLARVIPPDVLTIEDDHAAEVAGAPSHPLAGAHGGRWALLRSVSKPYGPDLRLAVLAGDADTVDRIESRQRLGAGWVSHLLQDMVVSLWTDPSVPPLLETAAAAYTRRRLGLVAALRELGLPATGRSGVNVWVPVDDEDGTVARLRASGWAVQPGSRFRIRSGPGLRVTISNCREEEIPTIAAAIAAAARPRRHATYLA